MTNLEPAAHRLKARLVLTLEGRIHLLQRIDVFGRFEYTIIANMITGTIAAIWLLLYYHIPSKFVSPKQMGFQQVSRRFIIVLVISADRYLFQVSYAKKVLTGLAIL